MLKGTLFWFGFISNKDDNIENKFEITLMYCNTGISFHIGTVLYIQVSRYKVSI